MTALTATATGPAVALADARFIDLVTFRRSGDAVATPVLFTLEGDRLLVRTAHDAGKLKRIRHTADVELAPADSRGRRLGPAVTGRARILETEAVAPALTALHAKHRIAGPLFTTFRRLRGRRDVIVEITLGAGAQPAIRRTGHRPASPVEPRTAG
jgi:PPOX class probable F420-dependent enzyme